MLSIKFVVSLVFVFASMSSYSSSGIVAHVLEYGVYGNGNVYVKLDNTIDQMGCNSQYLELPAGEVAKQVLGVAAIAAVTGSAVRVMADNCYGGLPSFAGQRGSYFVVNKL